MKPSISIVIPTKNAEAGLRRLLPALQSDLLEVSLIVCDGGSIDRTQAFATDHGVKLVQADGGRGPQLKVGSDAAQEDWILFLHADSKPQPGWDAALSSFMAADVNSAKAAYFQFALEDDSKPARRLERLVAWRCRVLGLPYGDQGLVLRRALLQEVGGVPEIPLMEDVALVRKIGKNRLVPLPVSLVTSAEKFKRDGYLRRSLRNVTCLSLYFLGVSPQTILRLYQ